MTPSGFHFIASGLFIGILFAISLTLHRIAEALEDISDELKKRRLGQGKEKTDV